QDSGEGYAYRSRASRTITVTQAGNRVTLAIPSAPRFQRVAAVELVGVESPPRSVRLDGKPARDVSYDARTRRARITLPDESVRQITWQP
ncbi:MAG TPA: hypothetical protein VLB69_00390, partial [Rudaea sp.]|nr:hypothetical protein [Rudaea sp.]